MIKGANMSNQRMKFFGIMLLGICLLFPVMATATPVPQSPQASSPLNLDDILKRLASYEYGQNEGVLWDLRNYVHSIKDVPESRQTCEEKLLAFLDSQATPAAKMTVCRQLRIIGSEKSAPVLEKLLLQKDMSDMARYALEKIPGEAADKALLKALANTKGDVRIGVISSLGQRKTRAAVAPLGALILDSKKDISSAAIFSLGRIGGKDAAGLLSAALGKVKPDLQAKIASALLICAEDFRALNSTDAASGIYSQLFGLKLPAELRRAAMSGKITTAGDQAAKTILSALEATDQDMYRPAISMVKSVFNASNIASVGALLPKLPEASQVQLLAVLADYPKGAVLSTILQAAQSAQQAVRIAGLKALEKVGDASTVEFLAAAAAKSSGKEQDTARTSLWGLKGREIDEAVLSALAKPPADDVVNELILSIGERQIFAAKSVLVKETGSPSAKIRRDSLRALKVIGTPSDIPGLLDLLLKTENEQEQVEVENTVAALAKKISNPLARSGAIKAKLEKETNVKNKCLLFYVLGRIGDDSALSPLREALIDPNAEVVDAAVRAIAMWPTATAKDDVLQINETTKNDVHEILTLQSYIRMIGLEKYRAPEAAVKDLKLAYGLADRPEEKKLVLGVLPNFACPGALEFAQSLLEFNNIKAEAQAAVDKLKKKLEKDASK
jgi:HEAT repeat protein